MNITCFLLVSSLLTSGCAWKSVAEKTPLIVDTDVLSAYSNYETTMVSVRTALEFYSDEVATNCKAYIEFKKYSAFTENSRNFLAAQDYMICETVIILKQSAENRIIINNDVDFSEDLITRLDLRSFRSSLFQRTDEDYYTLNKLFPALKKQPATALNHQ